MKPAVAIFPTAAEVARAAADEFAGAAAEAIAARGKFLVALAGGSTPKATYALLARPPLQERVEWGRVEIFFGDERCVPPDHADSNFRMAKEALLDHVRPGALHRIRGELAPEEAAREYAALVDGVTFDLALLGLGPDGHTASLFPGTSALAERRAAVVAVFVEKLHAWRVTLTAPVLSRARAVLVTAVGAEKADALALAVDGAPGAVPIQLVQPASLTYQVDAAAAQKLARS
jgi:6-phosphogluconolactonase